MDSTLIERMEVGDYRISVHYDLSAQCPVTDWDMLGVFLWEYERTHQLSNECNWKEVWGKDSDNNHSMEDTLRLLIEEHCDFDSLVKYIKEGKKDGVRLRYDRSARLWNIEVYGYWYHSQDWDFMNDVTPKELRQKDWSIFYQLFEYLGEESLLEILRECGKDIYVTEWSTSGYSQGDYLSGIAYCTKERYDKFCGKKGKPWKEEANECIEAEVDCIGTWAWGDVKGFVLEKKVRFTKKYEDPEREDEDAYEWEEVDSCWGYYMKTEELFEEVMAEHDIKEDAAA